MNKTTIDWEHIHRIHFVGIKGVAMAALAVWAKEKGYIVTGSDVADHFPTDTVLEKAGIVPIVGFTSDHIQEIDLVIYTGAHNGRENPEVVEAIKRKIPAYPHGQALGMAMEGKKQISVAGCHGKTTTAAMIATILVSAGLDPSYAIGTGEIRGLGLSGHAGTGEYFIAEADEYVTDPHYDPTPRFLWQHPEILVVTTIDFDHPDVYPDIEAVGKTYQQLVGNMTGKKILIWNYDDVPSRKFLSDLPVTHNIYGYASVTAVVNQKESTPKGNVVSIRQNNEEVLFTLKVPGLHNMFNAAAAILACQSVGLGSDVIKKGIEQFGGAARRFEILGKVHEATVIDDYAHHPQEIKATLGAAKEWYPTNRRIAVFQPHTYSRTKKFLHEFAQAFSDADIILIADIYASAREKEGDVTSKDLVDTMRAYHSQVFYCPSYSDVSHFFLQNMKRGDVVVFMGAGDIGNWGREFVGNTTYEN